MGQLASSVSSTVTAAVDRQVPTLLTSDGSQVAARCPATFRTDIEGLRGLAVLLVVAFHCGVELLRGGFVGVDVFFVLSGYLITGLLVSEVDKRGRIDLVQFYARRIRRLLPAAALTLAITLVVGSLLLSPHEFMFASRAARATAMYLSNMFFAVNAADYFAADVETNPLLHTWSLAVEEQFYLFWPLLILVTMRAGSRRFLIQMLWLTTIVSLAACIWLSLHSTNTAFYSLPTRAWEFSAGGLAALLPGAWWRLSNRLWVALSWIGVATIAASAVVISRGILFPGWVVLLPVVGTLVALVAGARSQTGGARVVLDSRPLQALGALSYSWYLWHWPFLVFTAVLFSDSTLAHRLAAAAASLIVAAVTHRLIENPIRFHPQLVQRPLVSIGLGVGLTIAMISVGFLSVALARRFAAAPEMRPISAAVDDIARMPRDQCVALASSAEVRRCVFGDQASAIEVVLFGDSHAIQWFNPLETSARAHGWRLTTFVKSGCPAADVGPAPQDAGMNEACLRWRKDALRQIVASRPALVVVASATVYLERPGSAIRDAVVSLPDWAGGTRRTIETLTSSGLRVAFMRDTPFPAANVPTCLGRRTRLAGIGRMSCDTALASAVSAPVTLAEDTQLDGIRGVHVVDMTREICPADVCRAVENGIITYRDDNHLTGRYADTLAPVLAAKLLAMLPAAQR